MKKKIMTWDELKLYDFYIVDNKGNCLCNKIDTDYMENMTDTDFNLVHEQLYAEQIGLA